MRRAAPLPNSVRASATRLMPVSLGCEVVDMGLLVSSWCWVAVVGAQPSSPGTDATATATTSITDGARI
jgi:hypothetical protein